MPNLKRDVKDFLTGREWRVYGTNGAISWKARPELFGPIVIHSPHPIYGTDDKPSRCHILEGACYVGAGYLGGDQLGQVWADAGGDDNVIWRELEEWYTAHLTRD